MSTEPDIKPKPPLTIYLAAPRGFCAGVDRAIQIVERALEKYGSPVYVRHEIVHNKFVVDSLKAKGAVFVESLGEISETDSVRPVIFSAHGVPKCVPKRAQERDMFYIDATCPLVSKVHKGAERYYRDGCHVVLIGHEGHPEVVGTMGQLPEGAVVLVETLEDVKALHIDEGAKEESDVEVLTEINSNAKKQDVKLAYCSQTTLSVDDTSEIVAALHMRFPSIKGPKKEDICYATTNRQAAIKAIAKQSEVLFVIGAPNSSNSNRLVEVAAIHGCARSYLLQRAADIDWHLLENVRYLGLSAGASAPEVLVDEVIDSAREHFDVTVEEVSITKEDVKFKIPKVLS